MPSALGKTSRSPFGVASSFIVCCLLLMVSCGGAPGQGGELRSGDLLFVEDAGSALGEAISASTGSYTHVAMVWRDSALWVVEATAPEGVRRVEYGEWMAGQRGRVVAMRPSVAVDTAALIARAEAHLGEPYDSLYLPGNGAMYCSELVAECMVDMAGRPLFSQSPMRFRDESGELPPYWVDFYSGHGMAVPEGLPGTNPSGLAASPLLVRIGVSGK
ncbi:MAG: hypothetical protein IJ760_03770 [Bacteroidales bacterium]|nr:hypothetical protein [Bacteroidales bacterium]